jgi:calcineurin-like phosphoesterase family protein
MANRWVISDTHFGHKNIIVLEAPRRPFRTIAEHDEELIERWNAVVKPSDKIWHLGDVVFGRGNFPLLGRLNGKKRLVLGNHDNYDMALYAEHFERVRGVDSFDGVALTHVPAHPCQFPRFRGNIHGHMHSKQLPDSRYFNAAPELNGLAPVAWEDAVARFEPRDKS